MGSVTRPLFINLCAGDRWFAGWEGSDIAPQDPRLKTIDATSLPYADATVDVAMMSHALTPLQALENGWQRCFDEVFRVLRPGGWFRIDDEPRRFYLRDEDIDPSYAMPVPRSYVIVRLQAAGFMVCGPSDGIAMDGVTTIPGMLPPSWTYTPQEAEQLRAGLVDNKTWHVSWTLECLKPIAGQVYYLKEPA